MRHRPSDAVIDWWLVVGAAASSVLTALTGFGHGPLVTRYGLGNPAIRALVFWVMAVAVQAVAWFAWTVVRRRW